jgi:hypothetical protein
MITKDEFKMLLQHRCAQDDQAATWQVTVDLAEIDRVWSVSVVDPTGRNAATKVTIASFTLEKLPPLIEELRARLRSGATRGSSSAG